MRARLGPDHRDTLVSQNSLARAYQRAGEPARAIPLLRRTLDARRSKLGPGHPDTLTTQSNLAVAYQARGELARAEALFREALDAAGRKKLGAEVPAVAALMDRLGRNLALQRKWSEAEPLLRELLKAREAKRPDGWETFSARSLLGGSLLAQGRYAEAEPLVVSGQEGLAARAAKVPKAIRTRDLAEAAERVIRLYEAWGKPDQAAAWKDKLGLADLPADVFARP